MSEIQAVAPITVRGLHRGMADDTVLADALVPSSQMRRIINMDTDSIGNLTRCKGYSRVGTAAVVDATESIQGLHYHKSTTAANTQLVAFSDNAADTSGESYYLNGSSVWTNKALAFTAGNKIHATTFLNYIIAANGVNAPASWTGAVGDSWGTTNLTSAPTGSLIETFRQQVYIGTTSNDTVQWSSVPSAGAITWPASGNSFQLNPNDGSSLTALKRAGTELLLFKNDYMYRYNGRATEADSLIAFGTPSQEAVTLAAGTVWFFDARKRGIYGYAGGYPQWQSKLVDSFLKAIPSSALDDVVMRGDDDHVECYIGDVTVNGVTISKCAVRYTISSQTWTLRSYAHAMTCSSFYDDGTSILSLYGTTTNDVIKMEQGNTFLATSNPIGFEAETAWLVIGGNPATIQTLVAFAAFVQNGSSMAVQYRVDSDLTWREIGTCRDYVNAWPGLNADFHRIKFRFTGVSTDADPAILEGFSMVFPLVKGVEKETRRYGVAS